MLFRSSYTRLLWLFEGFTSYYDDLMLVRSGLISEAQYLEMVAKTCLADSRRRYVAYLASIIFFTALNVFPFSSSIAVTR